MNVLGLNAYHGDAAAAIVVDGALVGAVEEERLNRIKHSAGFPERAVRWCLSEAGLGVGELDHIAVSRDPRANLAAKVVGAMRRPDPAFLRARLAVARRTVDARAAVAAACGVDADDLPARLHHVEHHRAHVASAFLVSPFERAAIASIDGFGDYASTMLAQGAGRGFTVLDRVLFPHSLGLLYTAVTQYLGFPHYGDEGKVMGLAPYGRRGFDAEMAQLVRPADDTFRLDLSFFTHHRRGFEMSWSHGAPSVGRVWSDRLVELLGPAREPGAPLTDRHRDIAASLQGRLEDVYLHVLDRLARRTGERAVCLAGGVALNAVANGMIQTRTPFEEVYVQPAAGDSGTAVGAAFDVYNTVLNGARVEVMDHAYTGPSFDDAELVTALDGLDGVDVRRLSDDELFTTTAERIAAGEVVGWFQGRMEFGPRALGNRSIVADPRRGDMKDTLNARIKHREPFRPFAPSVLAESASDFYEDGGPSPFMVLVRRTRAERRADIPAVDHVDGTGRVQTVTREANPRYHALISTFAQRTGTPVVLNTSFNENEPVVCTPQEAVACFERTRMDVLVLGNYVVRRVGDA